MLAIIGAICFAISWFIHGSGASGVPVWFNWQGLAVLGLVFVALHLIWPIPLRRQ